MIFSGVIQPDHRLPYISALFHAFLHPNPFSPSDTLPEVPPLDTLVLALQEADVSELLLHKETELHESDVRGTDQG